MNKIEVVNDAVVNQHLNGQITCAFLEKNEVFHVSCLDLNIVQNTELYLDYTFLEESKLDIVIHVAPHTSLRLLEQKRGKKVKIQYKFYLEEKSNVQVERFHAMHEIKESDIMFLNGPHAQIEYVLKTIAQLKETYDIVVYHNASKTASHIITNGVSLKKGNIVFQVSGFVPKGIIDCHVNQNNRIVSLNQQKNVIQPNLFIDENDVEASHAAHIGTFSDEEVFYLQSRGLSKETVFYLLVKGFLLSHLHFPEEEKQKLTAIIDAYWR